MTLANIVFRAFACICDLLCGVFFSSSLFQKCAIWDLFAFCFVIFFLYGADTLTQE